tara:strand:+ start:155 stop:1699 length:1545 start_codon:yes stop_codon:yes gene_type:complete
MAYKNETIAASLIFKKWKEFQNNNLKIKVLNLIGKLQAGKTGTVKVALRLISDVWDEQTNSQEFGITVLTTYPLKDLNSQIARDYGELDDIVDIKRITIIDNAIKKDYLGKNKKVLDSIKGGIVVIDEAEYGVGNEGRVQRLLDYLVSSNNSFFFIFVGATNYSLQDSVETSNCTFQVSNVIIEPGENYRGIEKFWESDKFINLDGKSHKFNGPLPQFVLEALDKEIKTNSNGVYFLRANQTQWADEWEGQLKKVYEDDEYNVVVSSIHTGGKDKDKRESNLTPAIKSALKGGKFRNQIIIVVGSLSAGFTTHPNIKKYFRFGLEHNLSSKAGAVQGIPGRMCGYNLPYMPTIIASKSAFEEYLNYHKCIRSGEDYKPNGNASTQLKGMNQIQTHVDCKLIEEFHISKDKDIMKKYGLIIRGDGANCNTKKEDVKGDKTKRTWKKAVSETKKDNPNYTYITWLARFKGTGKEYIMRDFTILKWKSGKCQLWKKTGVEESVIVHTTKNSSVFAQA